MPHPPTAAQPQPNATSSTVVEITAADLPLHCPMSGSPLWNSHPRVFLPIEEVAADAEGARHIRCPYCGTEYVLRET